MLRWVWNHFFIIVIYITFMATGSSYLLNAIRYRGVESWPSVEAEIIDFGGETLSFPTQTRFGSGSTSMDTHYVEFEYSVMGKTFRGDTATPDGGGLPFNPFRNPGNQSWRAYYKPSSPEVSVLAPAPFEGTMLFLVAVVSGVLALSHLGFTVSEFMEDRRRKAQGLVPQGVGEAE